VPGVDKAVKCPSDAVKIVSDDQITKLPPGTRWCKENPTDGSISQGTTKTVQELAFFEKEKQDMIEMRKRQRQEAEDKYYEDHPTEKFFNKTLLKGLKQGADLAVDVLDKVAPEAKPFTSLYKAVSPMFPKELSGSGAMPSKGDLFEMARATYKADAKNKIGSYTLVKSTPTLKFYKDEADKTIVVAIRGTKKWPPDFDDLKADAMIALNDLESSTRYTKDKAELVAFKKANPSYDYYGVGHSLGGAILDGFLREGLLKAGRSYNPAVQQKDFNAKLPNQRVYQKGDPLHGIYGPHLDDAEVREEKEKGIISHLLKQFAPTIVSRGYDAYNAHKLENFEGGADLERMIGGLLPPLKKKRFANLMAQLKAEGLSPERYLRDAKANAKANGYNPDDLAFSQGGTKLVIRTPEKKLVRFGATGLGDYLIYSQSDKELATQRRKAYLTRATKIKGEWKKNPYSKNNLAIRILWAG